MPKSLICPMVLRSVMFLLLLQFNQLMLSLDSEEDSEESEGKEKKMPEKASHIDSEEVVSNDHGESKEQDENKEQGESKEQGEKAYIEKTNLVQQKVSEDVTMTELSGHKEIKDGKENQPKTIEPEVNQTILETEVFKI